MEVLMSAGIVLSAVLVRGLCLFGLGLYVVVNVVLANWANYCWHGGEPTEEGDENQ